MLLSLINTLWVRRKFTLGIFLLIMLFSGLVISFIPIKYTATAEVLLTPKSQSLSNIQSPDDLINYDFKNLEKELKTVIFNPALLQQIAEHGKLIERREFNPNTDPHRAKAVILYEYLSGKIPSKNIEDIKKSVTNQMVTETGVKITKDNNIIISYTSHSPHLARFIANSIVKKVTEIKDLPYNVHAGKSADLPQIISFPNIIYCLYCAATVGMVLALLATILIKPRDKAIKNGKQTQTA